MILNYIWVGFFLLAFVWCCYQFFILGNADVFAAVIEGIFSSAKTGFEISIGLTGVMTLWLGLMKIGEKAGAVNMLSRIVGPFFSRLFPELPKNHPALGNMLMNFSANMLGLDNAATPLGLKAMKSLQEENRTPDTSSNAQIMFLVLNTSGLTIIPISIMVYRAQLGAADPSDIFIPVLIATFFSTLVGLISVAIWQRINLFNRVVLSWLVGITTLVGIIIWYFSSLPKDQIARVSSISSNFILFSIIIAFILGGLWKKINLYDSFIDGAKEGFETSIKIIPYLIAMLVAIAAFRESGVMHAFIRGAEIAIGAVGMPTDFVGALPTAIMKPLSGSGARTMMVDAMKTYGADSFVGRLSCMIQGSADTTFFIVALYFGSVGIKKTRYAITCGLIADLAGLIAAILTAYVFFS
ncbi:MAG: hypothetical protein J0M08_02655 [Bacteroidetes bacterium]|nr:hypothetical protein [Bacteroidota bacterium]